MHMCMMCSTCLSFLIAFYSVVTRITCNVIVSCPVVSPPYDTLERSPPKERKHPEKCVYKCIMCV